MFALGLGRLKAGHGQVGVAAVVVGGGGPALDERAAARITQDQRCVASAVNDRAELVQERTKQPA